MDRQGSDSKKFYERVSGLRAEAFDLIDEVRGTVVTEPRLLHELQTVANHLGSVEDLVPWGQS